MGRLDDKVILITGAASGMGENHARRVAQEGAQVAISDINVDNGKKIAEDIGEQAIFVQHDVTSEDDWNKVVKEVEEAFGPITGLVNNAAILDDMAPIDETSLDSFEKTMKMNATSTFLGMRAVIPSMKEEEMGSIVNISSQAGIQGNPDYVAYVASKFAVTGMTQGVALEVGQYNIRVNSIHPGVIMTDMTSGEEFEELIEELIQTIPLGKVQEKEDITNMVLYLLSDESAGSTGSQFAVDGGMSI